MMAPKKGNETWTHLENLCTEYGIHFPGEVDPSQWPDCHRLTLENAKVLSDKTYDAYATAPGVADSEPWKIRLKSLASLLVETAGRCRQRNESSWRFACEPIILGRLSSEVCCRNCRKRVWRSDIEVSREGDSATAERLQSRQKAREPCRCPRTARSRDHLEATGLNSIFSNRADETVRHDEEIFKRLGKNERPDSIYGLRQTRNIENLLHDAVKSQFNDNPMLETQVYEILGLHQPLIQTGDRLLFPFLVLEAKSASSDFSWPRIQLQTAFSIRTFLKTQEALRTATGKYSKWESGPLVWFLANRGEDWRLYAAYMERVPMDMHTIGRFEYRVLNVWSGSIVTRNGALQLLLLVDYIFDWARDIYREDIIRELGILATGGNAAASILYSDHDIISPPTLQDIDHSGEQSIDEDGFKAFISAQESFEALDARAGVIRHASLIESKYCCVYITRDNVQTTLQSIDQSILRKFCLHLQDHLKSSFFVDLSKLDAIEQQWTGTSRLSSHQLSGTKFHTVVSVTTYISSNWHLIRELFVIAIATDAWSDVEIAIKRKPKRGSRASLTRVGEPTNFTPELSDTDKSSDPDEVSDKEEFSDFDESNDMEDFSDEALLDVIKRLQAGSAAQILHSAITRSSLRIVHGKIDGSITTRPDSDAALRRVVHFVYTSFKKGIIEPDEPFIRFSRRLDQQHLLKCDVDPYSDDVPHLSEHGCVLIAATPHSLETNRSTSKVCAYLTADTPNLPSRQELSTIITNAFATRDVYHTTRCHWVSTRAPLEPPDHWERHVWNLQGTYGVYSSGFEFFKFIRAFGSKMPITQGSLRETSESGASLYDRNLYPWTGFRLVCSDHDIRSRMFISYKLFSQEIRFWRAKAQERRRRGLSCCRYCAAMGKMNTCVACRDVLDDPNRQQWFKDCLLGKQPFKVKHLTGSKLQERLSRAHQRPLSLKRHYPNRCNWAWNLDFYPNLEVPFRDTLELWKQWVQYQVYCMSPPDWDLLRRKRKREDSTDTSSEGLSCNDEGESSDDEEAEISDSEEDLYEDDRSVPTVD